MKKTKIIEVSDIPAINLAVDTIKRDKQALVFVNSKRSAEKTAEDIAKKISLKSQLLDELADKALNSLESPTKQCRRLSKCLERGIAFHHSGLTASQKRLVENHFRKGNIKIIACTPTLAAGLDLPAFRTIIRDLKRYTMHGLSWIPVLEYEQQAGRAGRPKYDSFGESVCIANSDAVKEEITDKYLNGTPENIYSKLAVEPVLRTYILSLVSSNLVNDFDSITEFFKGSFWAYQYKDDSKLRIIIMRMIRLLEGFEFVIVSKEGDFVSANNLDDNSKIRATPLGRRVSELYLDPLTANDLIQGLKKTNNSSTKEFPLLQLVCHTLEMRPLIKAKTKDFGLLNENIIKYSEDFLEDEPSIYDEDYDSFMDSVKTASVINEWIDEVHEDSLLEEYNITPGGLKIKVDLADWLLYSLVELARILHFQETIKDINRVRERLKYGVKEELLPLLKFKDVGRVRARKLFTNKIRDVGDVKKADYVSLAQLLGKGIAASLKNQVGEKVNIEELKVKKRAQTSLDSFK